MKLHRSRLRGAALALAATGLVVAAGPAATAATAPIARLSPDAATALAATLGTHSAGAYLDAAGRVVVTVTDASAAATVRRAGGAARTVRHGGAQLLAADAALYRSARITGTAWVVDPVSNQVVVSADTTVTGAKLTQLRSVVATLGDAVRVERLSSTLREFIGGGAAIYGSNYRCSLGFNVANKAGAHFFLTAGHCGNLAGTWYSNVRHTTKLGNRVGSSFPGNDYALIKYTSSKISKAGSVMLYNGRTQDIRTAGKPMVGETVKRSGSTTHVHGGHITGLNATVNYLEGTVRGMIKTNVCAEGGDSGGPLFHGIAALGLTSGGSGNCTSGGTTFYQPVAEALSHYNVHVY